MEEVKDQGPKIIKGNECKETMGFSLEHYSVERVIKKKRTEFPVKMAE